MSLCDERGLSSQTDGMPLIQKDRQPRNGNCLPLIHYYLFVPSAPLPQRRDHSLPFIPPIFSAVRCPGPCYFFAASTAILLP